jgi:hypothetical protein
VHKRLHIRLGGDGRTVTDDSDVAMATALAMLPATVADDGAKTVLLLRWQIVAMPVTKSRFQRWLQWRRCDNGG